MYRVLQLGFIIGSLVVFLFTTGCASHTRTVRTETVYPSEPVTVEHQTTTTETTDTGGCGGVLSCTVEVTGEVIALPFRAVAGLVRVIF